MQSFSTMNESSSFQDALPLLLVQQRINKTFRSLATQTSSIVRRLFEAWSYDANLIYCPGAINWYYCLQSFPTYDQWIPSDQARTLQFFLSNNHSERESCSRTDP